MEMSHEISIDDKIIKLKHYTIRNIGIVVLRKSITKLIYVLRGIILVRLLRPEDFGIVGIVMTLLSLLRVFGMMGIDSAIIYEKDEQLAAFKNGFILAIIFSTIMSAVMVCFAPMWGKFYHDNKIISVTRVTSFIMFLSPYHLIPLAKLQKKLQFKKIILPEISADFIGMVVAVILAIEHFKYWSLLWGVFARQVTLVIGFYLTEPWTLTPNIDKYICSKLLKYSKHIFIANLLAFAIINLDNIIIGKVVGLSALGAYLVAYQWSASMPKSVVTVLGTVTFPTYSLIREDISKLQMGFLNILKYSAVAVFAISFGILAIAPEFVDNVLGEKWHTAIIPLQILTFMGLFRAFANQCGKLFNAFGRPDITAKVSIGMLSSMVILLPPMTKYFHIIGASIAIVVCGLAWYGIVFVNMLRKMFGIKLIDIWQQIAISFYSSLLMVFTILVIKKFLHPYMVQHGILYVIILISIGAIVYSVPIICKMRHELKNILYILVR